MKTTRSIKPVVPAKLATPNIKHIDEVPCTKLEYTKLFAYIAFKDNYTCYYCGKNHKVRTPTSLAWQWNLCFDFLDDTCVNLRDENLILVCVDQKECASRIAKRKKRKYATPTRRV